MSIKQAMDRLAGLYAKTGLDWFLTVHHDLTEPTCPTVAVWPEGYEHLCRYRVDMGSIEEGIVAATDLVFREVMLGEQIEVRSPITNPADAAYEQILAAGFKREVDGNAR